MSFLSSTKRKRLGTVLVVLQFGLLTGLVVLSAVHFSPETMSPGVWVMAGSALALAVWTLTHNRPGNFNIRPTPKAQGTLITSGPYQHIRHPMYTAVLLAAAALVLIHSTAIAWAAWAALVVVLFLKSWLEERWMHEQHPHYGAYMQRSKRFLPWIF